MPRQSASRKWSPDWNHLKPALKVSRQEEAVCHEHGFKIARKRMGHRDWTYTKKITVQVPGAEKPLPLELEVRFMNGRRNTVTDYPIPGPKGGPLGSIDVKSPKMAIMAWDGSQGRWGFWGNALPEYLKPVRDALEALDEALKPYTAPGES